MPYETVTAPLFDLTGRRIPPPDLGGAVNAASPRYGLEQPAIDYLVIHRRISEHLGAPGVSAAELADRVGGLLAALGSDEATREISRGVHVPFVIPAGARGEYGGAMESEFLPAVGRSWKACFPKYDFKNELKGGLADRMSVAAGSRHERLLAALANGPVVGVYFPLALSGFSVDAALRQMAGLPDGALLSGGFDAAAALVACPELLMKTDGYPPQLDLSALGAPKPGYGYHFASYGYNLTFNGRFHNGLASDYCSSGLTWISQKF
jgi:hypothetical protein